ncbi:MAG: MFS transporter, partial [Vulcanimicrobiaceae bacterium]
MKLSPRYAILTVTLALQTVASIFQQGVGAIQPMIAHSLHLDHRGVGLIVAALAAGSATFAAIAGIAVDYFGERSVLLWSGIAMGVTLCAAGAVAHLAWLTIWLFLFGMAYGTCMPSGGRAILLWFTQDRGFAMAIRQAGVPLGGVLGSLLLPVIALHWGYQAAIVTSGIVCVVVTVIGVSYYHSPAEHAQTKQRPIADVLRGVLAIVSTRSHIYFNITCCALVAAQY